MNHYSRGSLLRLKASFRDSQQALFDPESVAGELTIDKKAIGPLSIVRDAVGLYHSDVDLNKSGTYYCHIFSDGIGQASQFKTFVVDDDVFN